MLGSRRKRENASPHFTSRMQLGASVPSKPIVFKSRGVSTR